jgi:Xaa-Pro aminopeptidase
MRDPPILFYDTTYRRDAVVIEDCRRALNMVTALVEAFKETGLERARVGLIGDDLIPIRMHREIATQLPSLALEPADDLIISMRMVKSETEQGMLRHAAQVCGRGLEATFEAIQPGASESEVCAAGIFAAMLHGADFVRYVRTHSGPYSAWGARWPQAMPRAMQLGELVEIDFVGAWHGYQFDVLRTGVVGRVPSPAQRQQLETALRATREAIAAARPGVAAEYLVTVAGRVLEEAGFGKYASRLIGHGIGCETMEPPLLMTGDTTPLEPGMVLCVEPTIHIPDVGGACVEEEIVVTDGPPEVLTTFEARWW